MKLTLRDLFWLVLVCALALGWWADRWQLNWAREVDREILIRQNVEDKMRHEGVEWPDDGGPPIFHKSR